MTLLKELFQMNESITFELDIADDLDGAMKIARDLGATNIEQFDDNINVPGFSLTVSDKMMGNVIIDKLYGPDNNSRDSNEFYMGLVNETGNHNEWAVKSSNSINIQNVNNLSHSEIKNRLYQITNVIYGLDLFKIVKIVKIDRNNIKIHYNFESGDVEEDEIKADINNYIKNELKIPSTLGHN